VTTGIIAEKLGYSTAYRFHTVFNDKSCRILFDLLGKSDLWSDYYGASRRHGFRNR